MWKKSLRIAQAWHSTDGGGQTAIFMCNIQCMFPSLVLSHVLAIFWSKMFT